MMMMNDVKNRRGDQSPVLVISGCRSQMVRLLCDRDLRGLNPEDQGLGFTKVVPH